MTDLMADNDTPSRVAERQRWTLAARDRVVAWSAKPGSTIQALAAIGTLVVIGPLVLGATSPSAALGEAGTLWFIWWTLPKFFRRNQRALEPGILPEEE